MMNRLDNAHGARRIENRLLIDALPGRDAVTITFDGHSLTAYTGEPLLAALLAVGVRVLRKMSRTGEARGGYCLVGRCADCQTTVNGVPNCHACLTPVTNGMAVETQHGPGYWPGAGS